MPTKKTASRKPQKKKRTDKENLFIDEYLNNGFNATKAYITAGYSKNSNNYARQCACQLLAKPYIRDEVDNRIKAILEDKKELTARWIEEVKLLAFSNIHEAQEKPRTIQEYLPTKDGLKIKLHSKSQALQLLGRYLAILTDKQESKEEITINIKLPDK